MAALAVLVYLLFRIFQPFFGPILWAFLLALLLFPLNLRMRALLGGRRGLAASLGTAAVTLGIAIPVALGIGAFASQSVELVQALTEKASSYHVAGVEDVERLPLVGRGLGWLRDRFSIDTAQVRAWLADGARAALQFLLAQSRAAVLGVLGLVGNLALMLFVLFFFFRDGDAMAERVKRLIPMDDKRKQRLVAYLGEVTRAVVVGTLITAVVQGGLLGLGFFITGLPSPLVFGVLAGVASFIPFVGTGLVWVPAMIYLAAQGVAWKAIFFGIWSAVVVGSADNFLKPLFISGRAHVSTLTVFFGVMGGLAAFGMIGLFLGPVLVALAMTLIEFADGSAGDEVSPS